MSSGQEDFSDPTLSLVVPQQLVKTVKDALQAHDRLNKAVKIRQSSTEELSEDRNLVSHFLIATTWILYDTSPRACKVATADLLRLIRLDEYTVDIGYHVNQRSRIEKPFNNKLAQVVHEWLLALPPGLSETAINTALSISNWSYTIYPPMLLLPPGNALLHAHHETLFTAICEAFHVTHVALNGAIPTCFDDGATPNVIRSPTNLTPLHGDFGPSLPPPPAHEPTPADFDAAFWCSATQNGIFQTWAPRYTMFSRGNLSEKARVLNLPYLTDEISAVDLYAGIGYFAFSYAKAGVSKVLCWEINGWSVEGLRRGAAENGWGCRINEQIGKNERIVVFKESNEKAADRIEDMRCLIPPVRHVNCGFLPTSSDSWGTAVRVLDPIQGGWIHAHLNVHANDIECKKADVVESFIAIFKARGSKEASFHVSCEHVEIVKNYGPRIKHCVFDIAILPS